jgi:hypothetical protein
MSRTIGDGPTVPRPVAALVRLLRSPDPRTSVGLELSRWRRARRLTLAERGLERSVTGLVRHRGRLHHPAGPRTPLQAARDNLDLVTGALDGRGVDWFLVRNDAPASFTVAVHERDRGPTRAALDDLAPAGVYVRPSGRTRLYGPTVLAGSVAGDEAFDDVGAVRAVRLTHDPATGFTLGIDHGCDVEFWRDDEEAPGGLVAPRYNSASHHLPAEDLTRVPTPLAGREYPTAEVFTRRMLEDVTFPVDVVYTWVDGADPVWRERMLRARSAEDGTAHHPEAYAEQRFRSREELRYSLRSLDMYAPWVERVHVVTDGQVPSWLDTGNPRVRLVDHKEVFPDDGTLPVFNSNAIISRLHHVPDLAEHYLYLNDDVFLGQPLRPQDFFLPSGLALTFGLDLRRPFGTPSPAVAPHFALTMTMRRMLERELGVTVSRAIEHTPHPQLRSVQEEMELRFADAYARTARSRFRHHDDIAADQLFHYYAQATGRAVPGRLHHRYLNVSRASYRDRFEQTLRDRDVQTFCLNDTEVPGEAPLGDDFVLAFLSSYFPYPSTFERSGEEGGL